ncbi:imidazolonepropionase [Cytophagales bacterium LB-30]|uniref:Imidazolonepropionase n=1 Tax=Shiella aurantiaca TaxID=3058365 RepID=A0ABT8F3F3_9BACT|nr:imidazolonepropionase [Shiella aurantiaca]MDN4164985.1 imidazolonepropionase [Shiella aurantiaca]
MKLLINCKELVQLLPSDVQWVAGEEMSRVNSLSNAWLRITGEHIADFGTMDTCPTPLPGEEVVDLSGRMVMPCFVDSHTHLVFAGSRELEFVDKIKGLSYAEIAAKGGGIQNSARKLRATSEAELFELAMKRAQEVISYGTGVIEIKSGYGLTPADEIKMLRVAKQIGEATRLVVKTTFLGAHTVPAELKSKEEYIEQVLHEMIPQVAEEGLAEYCDVFCEKGFFTPEETERILQQGLDFGLKPKIHANQLHVSGGVQVGVKMGAISVDHLESMGQEEIDVLKSGKTMPTLLPGAAFFLRMSYPPARDMIAQGLPVAIASDYNPGSAPSGNMQLMMSLACVNMRMTPEEVLHATTINGAYALELSSKVGSIAKGKLASLIITKEIPSLAFIPYSFGSNCVERMLLKGEWV